MWLYETSNNERKTLVAAFAGYGVDALDHMIYTFVIPALMLEWGMSQLEAGTIATTPLITSAIGGLGRWASWWISMAASGCCNGRCCVSPCSLFSALDLFNQAP